jgi:hypothetical protein
VSATGRGAVRNPADYYPTPSWAVRRLLERVELPGNRWLEPCAGDGAIIRAVNSVVQPIHWTAVDIRPETRDPLKALIDPTEVYAGYDFLAGDFAGCEWDTICTNPPFGLAMEFIEESLSLANWVAMLLRVNFLGSAKRSAFFRDEMPDVYVLPNRPSFTGKGTDATEYCWAVWTPERGRKRGRVEVLAETPANERRAA